MIIKMLTADSVPFLLGFGLRLAEDDNLKDAPGTSEDKSMYAFLACLSTDKIMDTHTTAEDYIGLYE